MRFPVPAPLRNDPGLAAVLMLVGLIMGGNSLVTPMLPIYGAEFGVGGTMIGLLITLFAVGRLVVNLPTALFSRRIGARNLIYAGAAVIAVGSVIGALARSYEMLLLARFVQGLGSGMYMTTANTLAVEFAKPSERGLVIAMYQGSVLTGVSIGPAIGGFTAAHFGYSGPFWLYAGVAVAAIAIGAVTFRGTPPVDTDAAPPKAGAPSSIGGLLMRPTFLILCLIYFSLFFSRAGTQNQLMPLVANQEFGISLEVIGIALGCAAAVSVVAIPLIGKAIARFGSRPVNIVSCIGTGIGLLIMALATNILVFWAGLAISAISNGFNGPAAGAAVADEVPRPLLAAAISFQRMSADIALITAPIVIGLIYDFTPAGHSGGFLFTSMLMLSLGSALFLISRRRPAAGEG